MACSSLEIGRSSGMVLAGSSFLIADFNARNRDHTRFMTELKSRWHEHFTSLSLRLTTDRGGTRRLTRFTDALYDVSDNVFACGLLGDIPVLCQVLHSVANHIP